MANGSHTESKKIQFICSILTRYFYIVIILHIFIITASVDAAERKGRLKIDTRASFLDDKIQPKHRLRKRDMPYNNKTSHDIVNCTKLSTDILPKLEVIEKGHGITLECAKCKSAEDSFSQIDENYTSPSTIWKWKPFQNENVKWRNVSIDNEYAFISPENDLVMENLNATKSGFYYCFWNNLYMTTVYRLDVIRERRRIQVYSQSEEHLKAAAGVRVTKHNIIIFTEWTPWTSCNRCDKRGHRKRAGICMVKKLNKDKPIDPKSEAIFKTYPSGIPCLSTILPAAISSLKIISKRQNELEWGYCWEPCPTVAPVTYIRDENGNVIEVVETGKGYMSLDEAKPTFSPKVIRKTIYQVKGQMLIIECPMDEMFNKMKEAIKWQNESQVIDPVTINRFSHGRIHVDILNRVVIYPTELSDTASYSCWKKKYHVATVKVRIVKNLIIYNDKIESRIMQGVIGLIILALFCICFNICRKQRSDNSRYM